MKCAINRANTYRPIKEHMTTPARFISPDEALSNVEEIMKEHHIHHLPVVEKGIVLGIVSFKDISDSYQEGHDRAMPVSLIMSPNPYVVQEADDLSIVAEEMLKRNIGSAIIENKERVFVGVFTKTDALKMLEKK